MGAGQSHLLFERYVGPINEVGLRSLKALQAEGRVRPGPVSTAFFHLVNTRHERGHPTIVTTNRGLPAWGEIFGDTVVAAAILDRLMHHAIVFNIRGPSWRLREHNGLEIATRTTDR